MSDSPHERHADERIDRIVISADELGDLSHAPDAPTSGAGADPPTAAHTSPAVEHLSPEQWTSNSTSTGWSTTEEQHAPLQPPPPTQASPSLPGLTPDQRAVAGAPASPGNLLLSLGANGIVAGLIAGTIGGTIGMIAAEIVWSPDRLEPSIELKIKTGIWVAIIGAILGAVLAGWEGLTSGSLEKATTDGVVGGLIGGVAGFIGGFVAQWLYSLLVTKNGTRFPIEALLEDPNSLRLARAAAWSIFGATLGCGLGLRGGSRKAVQGLLGGLAGGAIAGLVFEQIELSTLDGTVDLPGWMVRLIGLAITGAGIGLGIGLVERVLRTAWITITGGPMRGKEFILHKPSTSVGSDYRGDVVIVKDPTVAPTHAYLVRAGNTTSVTPAAGAVVVNNVPTPGQVLRNGDTITIGQSTILFQERASNAAT